MKFTSEEEVSHVSEEQFESKEPKSRVFDGNGGRKTGAKPTFNGNGKATQAQCRALFALTRKAKYTDEDVRSLLGTMNATAFQELTRESASDWRVSSSQEAALSGWSRFFKSSSVY